MFRLVALVIVAMQMTASLPSEGAHPAREVIENLHTTLLTVMKEADKIDYKARYDRLAPVITNSFDLPFIAETVVGKYWETFSNDQKSQFIETFSKLSIAIYAHNFDGYSGERFTVLMEKEVRGGQILVTTQLLKSDGGEIQMDYILHRLENQWRIINIITDGVSDLALKRADYTSFLKNKSFDALIGKLNEKIADYSR